MHPQIVQNVVICQVLAAVPRARRVGNSVLVGMVLLALAVGVWWGFNRCKQRYGQASGNSPRRLFAALCRAHKLDRGQQRILMLIVQWNHLPQPAEVFLRPDLFDADHLGAKFATQFAQIQKLRLQLFGTEAKPLQLAQPAQKSA
jgi:hypothetical protein